mgnify:CR=1 FL=1
MKHIRIEVKDKKNIYDAVSENLKKDIIDIGINNIKEVEYIQVYTLGGGASKDDVKKIATEILTDKVSQECDYTKGFIPKDKKAIL